MLVHNFLFVLEKSVKHINFKEKKGTIKVYKLIAIDLDGTMLNSYGEVTENTKKVIKETMKKDKEVIIASGRAIDSIKAIAKEIDSKKYLIAGNGSIVYDIQNDKIIYEKYLSKVKALNIIKICEENSISYSVYTNKTIIANALKYNILYYYKENLKKEDSKKTKIKIVEDIYKYVKEMQDEKVIKVIICDKNEFVFKAILKKIEQIDNIGILDVSHMSKKIIKNGTEEVPLEYFYTEITEKNVDKWYALEFLINKLKIDKKEVITIGDNVNDKKMIEEAGLGIAMKGSTPKITNIANYITEYDNDNEGVAEALKKFC